ncbi:UNC93-like protein MFSD11 [Toxorhynchites rutilus septentrionalis]|uniref:UNC93-like protein MFSD11 n=1 Tax=Toxorhynchites rutilus septentrionalis TaxID=329112 RepID=UPI002478BAA1|nr:UNC93-like protein MFSD11 [Toxorhynchites rutilus septentrionalis]
MDHRLVNVIILGLGFMFLFTAFQTMGNIEQTVINSIKADEPTFEGDGYTSLAVIYAMLSVANWLTPSVLSKIGPKVAMLLGAITYCVFIVTFMWPRTWLLYVASAVLGSGAALIWIGQGMYLSKCSDEQTISRNSGIFWAMLQMSMFFGNLLVFFMFQGKTHIDMETRTLVFSILTGVAIIGIVFLCCLRNPHNRSTQEISDDGIPEIQQSPKQALVSAIRLFVTKRMLLLSVSFIYTGLALSFFSGVYGASIGFTNAIGETAKQLVGLNGVFLGVGEVLGGIVFGLLGKRTTKWGRDPIVIIGFIIHIMSFFLVFMNLPDSAPFGDTDDVSYFDPPVPSIAILCSFLLGLGDACFNTQIYSMLGGVFAKSSAEAFSIFKFTQSVATAVSFVYSSHLGLRMQLAILLVSGILGTMSFCAVEWPVKRSRAMVANESKFVDIKN